MNVKGIVIGGSKKSIKFWFTGISENIKKAIKQAKNKVHEFQKRIEEEGNLEPESKFKHSNQYFLVIKLFWHLLF